MIGELLRMCAPYFVGIVVFLGMTTVTAGAIDEANPKLSGVTSKSSKHAVALVRVRATGLVTYSLSL